MSNDEFSTADPHTMSAPLAALWCAKQGDWARAHELVQSDPSADGAWVHAYLHRVEGDLSNAAYWYARAGQANTTGSLDDEWSTLVEQLLR